MEYADSKNYWEATVHASRPEEYSEVWQIIKNIPDLYQLYIKSLTKLTEVWVESNKLFGDLSHQYHAMINQLKNLGLGKLLIYNKVINVTIEVQHLINRFKAMKMKIILRIHLVSSHMSTRSCRSRSKGSGLDIRLLLEEGLVRVCHLSTNPT